MPVFVGVTGHRNPAPTDLSRLGEAVRSILFEIRERAPGTPIVLLSSLAEGADQLAAEVVLEAESDRVLVPLPFERERYAQTMSDQGRATLERLLEHARVDSFVVSPQLEARCDPEDLESDDPQTARWRRTRYAAAGMWVARNCQALIALWDGVEPSGQSDLEKPSGTAEIVRYKTRGTLPELAPRRSLAMDYADGGPVFHVLTARSDRPPPNREVASIWWIQPGWGLGSKGAPSPTRRRFLEALSALSPSYRSTSAPPSDFGTKTRTFADWLHTCPSPKMPRAKGSLFASFGLSHGHADLLATTLARTAEFNAEPAAPPPKERGTPPGMRDGDRLAASTVALGAHPRLQEIGRLRAKAAYASDRYKEESRWTYVGVFVAIFTAAVSFHLYAHLFEPVWSGDSIALDEHGHARYAHGWYYLAAFLALILGTFLYVLRFHQRAVERKALDYRALAEALRVQIAWGLAGIDPSVATSYLQRLRTELGWIRAAALACAAPTTDLGAAFRALPDDKARHERLEAVRRDWVDEQRGFFATNERTQRAHVRRCRIIGLLLAVVGWGFGFATLAGLASLDPTHPTHGSLIAMGCLTLAGGMIVAFGEKKLFEEMTHQYGRMHQVFREGNHAVQTALNELAASLGQPASTQHTIDEAHGLIFELGREALSENAAWLVLHRARPLEAPIH